MRILHLWDGSGGAEAKRCAAYLQSLPIDCHVEENQNGAWELYVHDERDRKRAIELHQEFMNNSDDEKYNVVVSAELLKQSALDRHVAQEAERIKHTVTWDRSVIPQVTYALIAISIFVAVVTNLGSRTEIATVFTFVEFQIQGNQIVWEKDIYFTEVWRFFTPMFLHFGLIHIIFNMLWLKDLGGIIERRFGKVYFLVLVLYTGAMANTMQYYIGTLYLGGTPNFGGMSGVVYALFGFLWIRGRMLPQQGFQLNQQIVIMMVAWFFLCFMMDGVANTAHATGLILGGAWGYFSALRYRSRNS
ncbi:MAG: rhomboid family intramembrane serine protease [Planctomycetes bacterium]|nr:rhomboid family intramembrane serine protease [Planctomycetota bacterium]